VCLTTLTTSTAICRAPYICRVLFLYLPCALLLDFTGVVCYICYVLPRLVTQAPAIQTPSYTVTSSLSAYTANVGDSVDWILTVPRTLFWSFKLCRSYFSLMCKVILIPYAVFLRFNKEPIIRLPYRYNRQDWFAALLALQRSKSWNCVCF